MGSLVTGVGLGLLAAVVGWRVMPWLRAGRHRYDDESDRPLRRHTWVVPVADALNAMLREAAREAGVEFIDPTSAFIGHGVGSDAPWINDLDWGGPGLSLVDPGSFHPNAAGHEAMAALLQEQLENPRYP